MLFSAETPGLFCEQKIFTHPHMGVEVSTYWVDYSWKVEYRFKKSKLKTISGGQSTQPQYLSQSIDTPGQILLNYKLKLLSQNFTWVKVLEFLL